MWRLLLEWARDNKGLDSDTDSVIRGGVSRSQRRLDNKDLLNEADDSGEECKCEMRAARGADSRCRRKSGQMIGQQVKMENRKGSLQGWRGGT